MIKKHYLVAREFLQKSDQHWSEPDKLMIDTAIASGRDISHMLLPHMGSHQNKGLALKVLHSVGALWSDSSPVARFNRLLADASSQTSNDELALLLSHHISNTLLPQSCNALSQLWANWAVEEIERATKETFRELNHRRREVSYREIDQNLDLHAQVENADSTRILKEKVNSNAGSSSLWVTIFHLKTIV